MLFILLLSVLTLCASREPFADKTDNNFQQDCLRAHNKYRARYTSCPPLKLDNRAIAYAKSRCNIVSTSEGLSYGNKGLKGYGENQCWSSNSKNILRNCSAAVKSWYEEYQDLSPGYINGTTYCTSVVWEFSKAIGCARCVGKNKNKFETYIICNYYTPPGNMSYYYPPNVIPPK